MVATFKEQRKQARLEAKKRFHNPFQVGDIMHHSWGYDQTNADFYQVVESKPASVVLKKIASKPVSEAGSSMSCHVMPVKDAFITSGTHALTRYSEHLTPENHTITKKVNFMVTKGDDPLQYFIPVPYGWCELWDGKPCYSSWYA
jgi:hypothetical protein